MDYYNYLRGIWTNGQPMTYGGNGGDPNNPQCDFMFPGDSDPNFNETWDETTAGNTTWIEDFFNQQALLHYSQVL